MRCGGARVGIGGPLAAAVAHRDVQARVPYRHGQRHLVAGVGGGVVDQFASDRAGPWQQPLEVPDPAEPIDDLAGLAGGPDVGRERVAHRAWPGALAARGGQRPVQAGESPVEQVGLYV
jgi:hypothetical protein